MRLLLFCLLLAACVDRPVAALPPISSSVIIKDLTASADLDLLFVIDDSASTQDKQNLFKQNFQNLIDVLAASPGGLPNLHLGVVDTTVDIGASGFGGCPVPDPDDDGLLQVGSGCGVNGRFVIDSASGTGRNYAGTLADTFACMASVGTSGCGFEAPLEAMKRALDGSRPENAGFLRDDATLAVVILTDEDDASVADPSVFARPEAMQNGDFVLQPLFAYACQPAISPTSPGTYTGCTARTGSYLTDPGSYVQFLSSIKDPAQTVVAVIASPPPGLSTDDSPAQQANVNTDAIATGPLTLNGHTFPLQLLPSTSCTIGGDSAIGRPALRLATFLSSYSKDHGRFYNVCQADYSAALADISEEVAANLSPCLPTGVQIPPNCTVVDVQNRGTAAQTEELVPPCGGGDGTCWSADQNAAACPASTSGWEVKITRSAPPPDGTITEVACAIAVQ